MVKIVGKDESFVKRVTCRSCASILEYTLNEVREYHGTDYTGGVPNDTSQIYIDPTTGATFDWSAIS